MKKFLFSIVAILTLSACSKKDDPEPAPGPTPVAQHTVLVYMSGENSLVDIIGYNLIEMIEGSYQLDENQHLIAFVDSTGFRNYPHIYEIAGGKATEVYRYSSDFYSSDPTKFREIIQWTIDNYPSDDYSLVLWGHATGWAITTDSVAQSRNYSRAYGQDNGTDLTGGSSHWMNITQMARALEGLKDQSVLPKLSFIFADCCNMLCAENGYELRDVTDYLIGSPAEIPGYGAPYQLVVPHLFNSGSALYKGIIDTYYDYYADYSHLNYSEKSSWPYMEDGYSVPLAVIDTKYIGELAYRTHDMLERATGGYPQYPNSPDLTSIAFYWYGDVPMMYDMRAVMERLLSEADFKLWEETYQLAVPYYRMSMKWMTIWGSLARTFDTFDSNLKYGCISMFIPQQNSYYSYGNMAYNKTSINFGWNQVMDWKRFGWE